MRTRMHHLPRLLWTAFLGPVLLTPSLAGAQGYAPEVAAQKMTVADGFAANLVAAEPMVRQPVAIEFDERGRLWVIQYLQYPTPAGLKSVKVDQYLRTVYDRIPEPPPKGPRGADRITIYRQVLRQAAVMALAGCAIGLLLFAAASRLIQASLYQVSRFDWPTVVVVPLLLLGVALFAAYWPARRATRVDPMVALRYE